MLTHSLSNCYKMLMVLLLLMCTEILSVIVKCQATKKEFILVGICLSFFMTYCSSWKKRVVHLTMLTHSLSNCYKKLMVLLLLTCTEILSVIVKCQATKKEFILVGICLSFFMTYCSSSKKSLSTSQCLPTLLVIIIRGWVFFPSLYELRSSLSHTTEFIWSPKSLETQMKKTQLNHLFLENNKIKYLC